MCPKTVPEQEHDKNMHYTCACANGLRNILVKYIIYQVYLTEKFLKEVRELTILRSQEKRRMLSEGRKWSREAGVNGRAFHMTCEQMTTT